MRRSADLACLGAATANNTLVNSCFNAVVLLDVKLRQGILRVCAGIADITKGRCIDDVPDVKRNGNKQELCEILQ